MNQNLKRITKTKKLYHLSFDNWDGKVFKPRIPSNRLPDEDGSLNRVCLSSSMSGAFRACSQNDYNYAIMFVHVPENIDNIIKRGGLYKPNENLVPDVNFTQEHWLRRPTKMKCIGKAKFYYKDNFYTLNLPKVKIKWIEKYE